MEDIRVIEAGLAVDDRGTLTFANGFSFEKVKRFYMVENFSTDVIRAWHGHMKEGKYVFVVAGAAIVAGVPLSATDEPDPKAPVKRLVLSATKPSIVFIPPGYANGFRPLVAGTKIQFFSTSTLEESKGDDYRFPVDYWGAQIWSVENR